MYSNLLKKIKEFDKITVFRHARPDGDCMFSSMAMYEFLKDNFAQKSIKLCGFEEFDLISKIQKVSDKFISNSLAIVLDSATKERVDDSRFINAKYIVKIDHHPVVDNYGNMNFVEPSASSACQVLTEILFSKTFSSYKISKEVCKYLYCGIVTDTVNFRTANTTSKTFEIASELIIKGKLEVSELVGYLLDKDLDTFNKVTYLRNKLIVKDNFGYIKLNKKQLSKLEMDPIEAKNNIDEIGSIKELNIWAFAVENNGGWDCSIRSKKPYIINDFAKKYGGGGHPNACAVRHINALELDSLLKELQEFSNLKKN